jgi:hypothetical protein
LSSAQSVARAPHSGPWIGALVGRSEPLTALRRRVEPKRLARLGYLDARREPGKTHERTVYTLTEKGLQALRDYARTPAASRP